MGGLDAFVYHRSDGTLSQRVCKKLPHIDLGALNSSDLRCYSLQLKSD